MRKHNINMIISITFIINTACNVLWLQKYILQMLIKMALICQTIATPIHLFQESNETKNVK